MSEPLLRIPPARGDRYLPVRGRQPFPSSRSIRGIAVSTGSQ